MTPWAEGPGLLSTLVSRGILDTRNSGTKLQIRINRFIFKTAGMLLFSFIPAVWQVYSKHSCFENYTNQTDKGVYQNRASRHHCLPNAVGGNSLSRPRKRKSQSIKDSLRQQFSECGSGVSGLGHRPQRKVPNAAIRDQWWHHGMDHQRVGRPAFPCLVQRVEHSNIVAMSSRQDQARGSHFFTQPERNKYQLFFKHGCKRGIPFGCVVWRPKSYQQGTGWQSVGQYHNQLHHRLEQGNAFRERKRCLGRRQRESTQ